MPPRQRRHCCPLLVKDDIVVPDIPQFDFAATPAAAAAAAASWSSGLLLLLLTYNTLIGIAQMGRHALVVFNVVFSLAILIQSLYHVTFMDTSPGSSPGGRHVLHFHGDGHTLGLTYVLGEAGLPLKFSGSLERYGAQDAIPGEILRQVELRMLQELVPSKSKSKFLLYTPTDGFGNQVTSLTVALKFAWLTRRTLVLPPLLGHYEGPARGNCRNLEVAGLTNQTEIRKGLPQSTSCLPDSLTTALFQCMTKS